MRNSNWWKAAICYFGVVFGIGFVLGVIRILLLVPMLGERVAELVEMPFMVLASLIAARWIGGTEQGALFKAGDNATNRIAKD